MKRNLLAIKDILSVGFPLDHPIDAEGHTLLAKAVMFEDRELVSLCLKHGASLDVTDHQGQTPLSLALSVDPTVEKILAEHQQARLSALKSCDPSECDIQASHKKRI